MALITKNNCIGVDCNVSRIQSHIWNNISWNKTPFSDSNYNSYQRAYRNETNSNLIWEVFKGNSDIDYEEVLYNDNYYATSFFIVSDETRMIGGHEVVDISIIFQIDLKKLYPTITHRADEEAHREVVDIIKNSQWKRKYTGLKTGIRKVYSEIGYGANKFDDLHPYHVFRIDLSGIKIC